MKKTLIIAKIMVFFIQFSGVSELGAQMNAPSPSVTKMGLPIISTSLDLKLMGLIPDPKDPLSLQFIVSEPKVSLAEDEKLFKNQSLKLIKYFLAGLTIPDEQMWVNLSPTEAHRIIAPSLGQTQMGFDLLVQDLALKTISAQLLNPNEELGQKFWNEVYSQMEVKGADISMQEMFQRIWIVPESAKLYEQNGRVVILENTLGLKVQSLDEQNTHVQKILEQYLIPVLSDYINHKPDFLNLRQIYNSLLLAKWYKMKLQETLIAQQYVDQEKLENLEHNKNQGVSSVYQDYVVAFEQGLFNFVQEDFDQTTQQIRNKHYITGGMQGFRRDASIQTTNKESDLASFPSDVNNRVISVDLSRSRNFENQAEIEGEKNRFDYSIMFDEFFEEFLSDDQESQIINKINAGLFSEKLTKLLMSSSPREFNLILNSSMSGLNGRQIKFVKEKGRNVVRMETKSNQLSTLEILRQLNSYFLRNRAQFTKAQVIVAKLMNRAQYQRFILNDSLLNKESMGQLRNLLNALLLVGFYKNADNFKVEFKEVNNLNSVYLNFEKKKKGLSRYDVFTFLIPKNVQLTSYNFIKAIRDSFPATSDLEGKEKFFMSRFMSILDGEMDPFTLDRSLMFHEGEEYSLKKLQSLIDRKTEMTTANAEQISALISKLTRGRIRASFKIKMRSSFARSELASFEQINSEEGVEQFIIHVNKKASLVNLINLLSHYLYAQGIKYPPDVMEMLSNLVEYWNYQELFIKGKKLNKKENKESLNHMIKALLYKYFGFRLFGVDPIHIVFKAESYSGEVEVRYVIDDEINFIYINLPMGKSVSTKDILKGVIKGVVSIEELGMEDKIAKQEMQALLINNENPFSYDASQLSTSQDKSRLERGIKALAPYLLDKNQRKINNANAEDSGDLVTNQAKSPEDSRDLGGIDMNLDQVDMMILRDQDNQPLPFHQQPFRDVSIKSLNPTIINIIPIQNIAQFLKTLP